MSRSLLLTMAILTAPLAAGASDEVEATSAPRVVDGREYLVPELADGPFHVDDGVRDYVRHVSFSPTFGTMGEDRLFGLGLGYAPNRWLAYEAGIGHTPGESVHALVHTLSALVRWPLASRLQPYAVGGYGMVLVFPGESLNADPATENTLSVGGGLEFWIRDDLALRAEARNLTIIGDDPNTESSVAYQYGQTTVGLVFTRGLDD